MHTTTASRPVAAAPFYDMTIRDVAAELGLTVKTVRNWLRRGELTTIKFGRELRFSSAEVAALRAHGTRSIGIGAIEAFGGLDRHVQAVIVRASELSNSQRERLASAVMSGE